MASLQFMRARGSVPQRETGTGMASLPGTHAPAAPAERDEGHDHNGHPTPPQQRPGCLDQGTGRGSTPAHPCAAAHARAPAEQPWAGPCPASRRGGAGPESITGHAGWPGKNARNQPAVLMAASGRWAPSLTASSRVLASRACASASPGASAGRSQQLLRPAGLAGELDALAGPRPGSRRLAHRLKIHPHSHLRPPCRPPAPAAACFPAASGPLPPSGLMAVAGVL